MRNINPKGPNRPESCLFGTQGWTRGPIGFRVEYLDPKPVVIDSIVPSPVAKSIWTQLGHVRINSSHRPSKSTYLAGKFDMGIYCHYGIRPQRPSSLSLSWFRGPNSIVVVYTDPHESAVSFKLCLNLLTSLVLGLCIWQQRKWAITQLGNLVSNLPENLAIPALTFNCHPRTYGAGSATSAVRHTLDMNVLTNIVRLHRRGRNSTSHVARTLFRTKRDCKRRCQNTHHAP